MFEEAQQQLGADSEILDMLADKLPIYHKRIIKEQNWISEVRIPKHSYVAEDSIERLEALQIF